MFDIFKGYNRIINCNSKEIEKLKITLHTVKPGSPIRPLSP